MTIARRQLMIGLFATGAGAALAACGGGGSYVPPTRLVWVLNLNPEFAFVDVSFGAPGATVAQVVSPGLPFQAMTQPIEIAFGSYSIGMRDASNPSSGRTVFFDNFNVDNNSPSVLVFYRNGTSTLLAPAPMGIVNYFDSNVALDVELDDTAGTVQFTPSLAFNASAPQASQSPYCRLRLRRATDGVPVYDSAVQPRAGTILIYPADPVSGLVAVVGLDYTFSSASAVVWPNTL
ncbi:MAG TPA: hypothetical protein VIM34_03915 [Burkholderiaceae bacterium]